MGRDKFKFLKIIFGALIIVDAIIWILIFYPRQASGLELYFLEVGQGDGSLAIFPGGVKILIDGGPINGLAQKNLENILSINDRYIDLIAVSHPQLDHFGGLIEIIKNYRVGAIVTGDLESENANWREFKNEIRKENIQRIILTGGDKIKYQDSQIDILLPSKKFMAKDVNDQSLAMLLNGGGIKAFFAGDLGGEMERQLAKFFDIDVDILKVSHHGSKFSSDPEFLKKASPLVSVFEFGKNSYGHPTKEVLEKLEQVGSQIFRTDLNGLIKIIAENGKLKVFSND